MALLCLPPGDDHKHDAGVQSGSSVLQDPASPGAHTAHQETGQGREAVQVRHLRQRLQEEQEPALS